MGSPRVSWRTAFTYCRITGLMTSAILVLWACSETGLEPVVEHPTEDVATPVAPPVARAVTDGLIEETLYTMVEGESGIRFVRIGGD